MMKIRHDLPHLIHCPYFPILWILLICLFVGLLIMGDYGESWDEARRYQYAQDSLEAYRGDKPGGQSGPFYLMLAKLTSDGLAAVRGDSPTLQDWHTIHFLTFLMGVLFLYIICLQVVGKWSSIGAALCFVTQPLLWGHAFINPKDIPFMAFFTGSIALGLLMTITIPPDVPRLVDEPKSRTFIEEWNTIPKRKRISVILFGLVSICLIGALWVFGSEIRNLLNSLMHSALTGGSTSKILSVFTNLAENRSTIPVESYLLKAWGVFLRFRLVFSLLIVLTYLIFLGFQLPVNIRKSLGVSLKLFFHDFILSWTNWRVLLAGVFLGMTTSIRALGPAAGLLVGLYLILKIRLKAIPFLVTYMIVAGLTAVITWPALWGSPVNNFLNAVLKASEFPWDGKVMFSGIDYAVDALPRSYLPGLMAIQFTEVSLILFLGGIVIGLIWAFRKKIEWEWLLIIGLWCFVPITSAVVKQPTLYDNFRHFLFAIPPVFILASLSLQWIFAWIKRPIGKTLVILVLLIPNIIWLGRLHPYQYIYYNSLVGGVGGAFRNYEMDYWGISYKEAAEFLNENAPFASQIIVWGPDHLVTKMVRPDLKVVEFRQVSEDEFQNAGYAVILTRHNKDLTLFPNAETVYSESRDGAIFVVIKQLTPPGMEPQ